MSTLFTELWQELQAKPRYGDPEWRNMIEHFAWQEFIEREFKELEDAIRRLRSP